ncbi:thioredoxin [Sediminispirochaeta smaragdinae]|uniref:Thioredoxin n=1 Tax=Sediminispirochaeta smaragdinae (strain DSM 11293 / JCM 15392 / SEBR 4228) TaxID=573413 RepID=E1R7U7_SEDSS|nr:thioredoxin [Sediminispirochaeta smaragdinae]ADK82802.1 thioredoxin [Sediminispirochaeta smaragdinae DSM 11293]
MAKEVTLTSANFEDEVQNSAIPVLVDFWAEWCVPCKMISPILEEIAEAFDGKIKVGKINVDQEEALAGRFNIISIPTLMVFKGGEVVNQQVGAGSRDAIEKLFADYI